MAQEEKVTTNNTTTENNPADKVIKVIKNTSTNTTTDSSLTPSGTTNNSTTNNSTTNTSATDTTNTETTSDFNIADMMNLRSGSATTKKIVSTAKANIPEVEVGTINHIDTTSQKQLIDQITQAAKDQSNKQIDYTVSKGVKDLQRAEQDAAEQYQTQRDQIAADEQKALDNQVLYAQARGDNGGIGAAQYGNIQNTAAINRMAVNKEQTKLATDTQRQINDLRAQGEFERADQLLSITQNYLSQLLELEQYAQQMNLSIDQFNAQLSEWEAEYQMNVAQYLTNTELNTAQLTGAFSDGSPTLANLSNAQEQLRALATTLLNAGIELTDEQKQALGLTDEQYTAYWNYLHPTVASSGGGGGTDYMSNWWRDSNGNQYVPSDYMMTTPVNVNEYFK